MHWEDTFYRVREQTSHANGFSAIIELMEDHPIYTGHFPTRPIVPGVCTLAMIRHCLSTYTERKVAFCTIRECKFLAPIRPEAGHTLRIDANLTDAHEVTAKVYDQGKVALKLKASIH